MWTRLLMLVLIIIKTIPAPAQKPLHMALLDSGWTLYQQGKLPEARTMNLLGIRLSRMIQDKQTEAQSMMNNGTIEYVLGNAAAAYANYDSSWQLYRGLQDTTQAVNALRNMALSARSLSLYGQGIIHCLAALDLLKGPGRENLKSQVLNTQATLYEATNNIAQAKSMLLQALSISPRQERILTNLGNTYVRMMALDSAIYCYRSALQLTDDNEQRSILYNNLGESYILSDSLPEAEKALTESLSLRAGDSLAIVGTYSNLAHLLIKQKKIKQASNYLNLADNALEKHPNERESLKLYELQRMYYEHTGNFAKALWIDSKYDSLSSKIFEDERIKVSELQSAHELNERDRRILENERTLEIRTAELKQKTFSNRLAIGVTLALTCISVVFFYLYQTNARLKHRNEMLIHEQNHRVTNNLQMIASLLAVQSSSQTDDTLRAILAQNETRIQSVALLHRMLYSTTASPDVDLHQYTNDMVKELKFSLGAHNADILVRSEIAKLSIGRTISIGLIVNELVTNSIKHSDPTSGLQILIEFLLHDEHEITLIYRDNGSRFQPERFHASRNFGVRLIAMQSKQLKGKYTLDNKGGGFNFTLTFPQV